LVAIVAFNHALALPLVEPLAAESFALAVTITYRLIVTDQDKRFLRKSFALYLAPPLIDRMLASNKPPSLGGETRIITAFFSDLAGFSTLSENLTPKEVVALMNDYLTAMTDIIEAHGGFVERYVGDSIAAMFGAPLDDAEHAYNGVRAAIACQTRLVELNQDK